MILCDTTFIIDLLRQDDDAFLKFKEISNEQEIAISVLSIFELWIGVSLCDDNLKERQRILNVIGNLKIFDLNRQSAEIGGALYGYLQKRGETISEIDCLIAGICLENGIPLLTRNAGHFARIKNLDIISY